MLRRSIYAGDWYPVERSEIERYMTADAPQCAARAIICPHAGWQYSGMVAGELFSMIQPAATYVLVGPNHRGIGADAGVYAAGEWETPLGGLKVNEFLAKSIIEHSHYARKDTVSHSQEHSLEVLLPFIKYTSPDAMIVPISLRNYTPEICKDLGMAIATAIAKNNFSAETVIVASTDMSHFLTATEAKNMDTMALDRIESFDPAGLLAVVKEQGISMCGSGPVAAVLWAAQELGAAAPELVRYTNSGAVTGDYDQVVSYAGFLIPAGAGHI